MSTIEEDFKRKVNVKKVVKAVKNIGLFALYSKSKDCTLLITSCFIINLNEEQAWEMQCALLVKELGKWYSVHKDGPIEGNPVKQSEVDLYYSVINDNSLNIIGFTELYLNDVALYADNDSGYLGIHRSYIEMLGSPLVKKSLHKSLAIVSDFHLVAPEKETFSEYLAPRLF